ncbi:MAG: hypothetical protein E7169_02140 [Firmicutes bacterium]|nr:hypothetical protein [Bacillota bacterium]
MVVEKKDIEEQTNLDLQFNQLENVILIAEKETGKDIVQGIELVRSIVTNIVSIGDYPNEYALIKTLVSRFVKNYGELHTGSDDPVTKGLIMGKNLVEQYYASINEVKNERNISNR